MLIKPLEVWIKDELKTLQTRESFVSVTNKGGISAKNRSFVNFTSKDSLDLGNNPRVIRSFHEAAEISGVGSHASRSAQGSALSLVEAEKKLAKFLGKESALFFSSKTQCFFSLLTAIVSESDHILFDEDIQAPILDLSFLIGFQNTPLSLGKELISFDEIISKGRQFFITEEVLSASGDLINPSVLAQAKRGSFVSVLDISNSALFDFSALRASADILVGSLWQLGFGSISFIAGDKNLLELIWNRSHTFTREAPLPSPCYDALSVGIELLPSLIADLEKVRILTSKLKAHLYPAVSTQQNKNLSSFVPLLVSSPAEARTIKKELEARGFLVESFSLSQHRKEIGALRFWINRYTTEEQVDKLCEAISEIRAHLKK